MLKKCIFLFLLINSLVGFSQDTLYLISGRVKQAQIDSFTYDFVYYHKIKKDGSVGKKKRKNLDHVFSLNYKDSPKKYIYQKDTMLDNIFSIGEMEHYLEGRRQARKHYKPYKTMLMGVGVGTGVALYSLFPIKYGEKERTTSIRDTITNSIVEVKYVDPKALTIPIPYWELLPIGTFVYYQGAAKNTKDFKADNQDDFKNPTFMVGYKETVIDRKVFAAVGSSVGSFLVTMLGYMTFDPLEK